MSAWVRNYRTFAADAAFANVAYDGTKYGRTAWAEAGWDYIITGQFIEPSSFKLPNAVANQEGYQSQFNLQIGPRFPLVELR